MAGFGRSYMPQFGGLYKTPAGKTQAVAGAGGAAPHVQAPAYSGPQAQNGSASNLDGIGGLLYLMGQSERPWEKMSLTHKEVSPEYVAGQIAQMSPEDKAAMEASQFSVDWRQAVPHWWDKNGKEVFPNEGLLGALGRGLGNLGGAGGSK